MLKIIKKEWWVILCCLIMAFYGILMSGGFRTADADDKKKFPPKININEVVRKGKNSIYFQDKFKRTVVLDTSGLVFRKNNKIIMFFGYSKKGKPRFSMHNEKGKTKVSFSLGKSGLLSFYDDNEKLLYQVNENGSFKANKKGSK